MEEGGKDSEISLSRVIEAQDSWETVIAEFQDFRGRTKYKERVTHSQIKWIENHCILRAQGTVV